MFKQNLRLFVKNKRISIPMLILLLYAAGTLIYLCVRYTIFDVSYIFFLKDTLKNCFLSFIVLFYASYEFFYLIKGSKSDEVLFSCEKGRLRTFSSMVAVVSLVPALLFIITSVINVLYCSLSGISDISYYFYIVTILFLYFFLGGIIPILIGALFSQKFKRTASYALAALIIFILSDISDFLPGSISNITETNYWPFKYIFSYILPNDLSWDTSVEYGWCSEIYRWNLVLFWVFLLGFLLLMACRLKSKKTRLTSGILVLALTAVNFVGFIRGGSHIELGPQFDSVSMESHFYNKYNVPKTKAADFSIKKYDMKLSIWRQLDADITMELSGENLDAYNFTLFHGYKIESVRDNVGNNLYFEREGDYLTVHLSTKTSSLNIKYGGSSPLFYSSSQGCILPGFFPYYPIPGFYDFIENQSYDPIFDLNKTDFEIEIDSPRQFYSNLAEKADNRNSFIGKTDYPTLISGFFKDNSTGNYRIIGITSRGKADPPLDYDYIKGLQELVDQYSGDKGERIDLSKYTIIDSTTGAIHGSSDLLFLSDDLMIIRKAIYEKYRSQLAKDIAEAGKIGYKEYISELLRIEEEETERILAEEYGDDLE